MYTSVFEYDTGDLPLYNDDDITGIDISDTKLMDKLDILDDEELILVFPQEGTHHEACQKFMDYLIKKRLKKIKKD